MAEPTGFKDKDHPDYVYKLSKVIYSLKQVPLAWYNELKNYLLTYGFRNSLANPSLFIYSHGPTLIYLLLYLDNIIVTGPSVSHLIV